MTVGAMDRRRFTRLAGLAPIAAACHAAATAPGTLTRHLKALEAETGGRLGVGLIDTGSGRVAGHRADERFPMCSTFKWLAAAALLARVDAGQEQLDRRVVFGADALLEWAPVTRQHTGGDGLTLDALCEAAIADSDNTAAMLILDAIGGLPGWNRFVRSLGDAPTRLDRGEPELNEAAPGDERDTTTPAAMAADLRRLLLGDGLSAGSRERLTQWMLATRTSAKRLRADLPAGWRLADKTGTGERGSASDVGIYWPPRGAPIVVAVYLTQARAARPQQEAAIAQVGRWVRAGIV